MMRLAVFDCDGTLVDSQANICRAMESCFRAHDLAPPTRDEIRRIVGLSLVPAIAQLAPSLDPELHVALADGYKEAFRAMRSDASLDPEPLFDGIGEAMAALAADGWLLGVATGKSDRGLDLILRHHGIHDQFITLQTADRHPSKPHPAMLFAAIAEAGGEPAQTVMIGDTSFDMMMAVNAGVHAVGVSWGYHDNDELNASGAHRIATHADQLHAYLTELVAQ